jgi:cyanophycin synthetase
MSESEPKKLNLNKTSCSYCGNAPTSHFFSFAESLIFITLDNHAKKLITHTPSFIKKLADAIPPFLFRTLAFFKLVEFSRDINKAYTFRSKIIWQEAERRGIVMEQIIFLGKPLEYFRSPLPFLRKGRKIIKNYYFESLPIRPEFLDLRKNWDDKVILKEELMKYDIPVPTFRELSFFSLYRSQVDKVFSKLPHPVIVKPRIGSRGRHTITNIHTLKQLREGIKIARQICSHLVVEEHLEGKVCRATLVNGKLAGFYMAQAPRIVGDGKRTIRELIAELDRRRESRVEPIREGAELFSHIARSGFSIDDVLPFGISLSLSHRMGRFFGGKTREMIDELHTSFVPVFEKAAKVTGLSVVGFDAIIPDPTQPAEAQKWGIIECNTLPFIDLHYFTLEGSPRNIAGMIWDMWNQ